MAGDRGRVRPARLSDRAFGCVVGIVFLIFGAIAWMYSDVFPLWTTFTAAVFFIVAVVLPGILLPLNRLWAVIGGQLMRATNAIMLGAVYFGVITPLGIFMRLIRRDVMGLQFDARRSSYLQPVRRHTNCETLKDMF